MQTSQTASSGTQKLLSASQLASLISAIATGVYIAFFTPLKRISTDRLAQIFSMLFLMGSVLYYFLTAWYIEDDLHNKLKAIGKSELEWWLRVFGILSIFSILFTIQLENHHFVGLPIFVFSFIVLYLIYFFWDYTVREIKDARKYVKSDIASCIVTIFFIISYLIDHQIWKYILL